MYLCTAIRDLAQLVAHYVRDVGVGRSSRLIPTASKKGCPKAAFLAYVCLPWGAAQNPSFLFSKDKLVGLGMIKVAFLLRGRPLLFYFPSHLCLERLPFGFSPICFPYDFLGLCGHRLTLSIYVGGYLCG